MASDSCVVGSAPQNCSKVASRCLPKFSRMWRAAKELELTGLKTHSDSCQKCGSITGIVECSDCGGAPICSDCFQKMKNMGCCPKDNPRPRAVAAANAMELWMQEIGAKEWLGSSGAKCPKLTRSYVNMGNRRTLLKSSWQQLSSSTRDEYESRELAHMASF